MFATLHDFKGTGHIHTINAVAVLTVLCLYCHYPGNVLSLTGTRSYLMKADTRGRRVEIWTDDSGGLQMKANKDFLIRQ